MIAAQASSAVLTTVGVSCRQPIDDLAELRITSPANAARRPGQGNGRLVR
jgi:hypothetical protein